MKATSHCGFTKGGTQSQEKRALCTREVTGRRRRGRTGTCALTSSSPGPHPQPLLTSSIKPLGLTWWDTVGFTWTLWTWECVCYQHSQIKLYLQACTLILFLLWGKEKGPFPYSLVNKHWDDALQHSWNQELSKFFSRNPSSVFTPSKSFIAGRESGRDAAHSHPEVIAWFFLSTLSSWLSPQGWFRNSLFNLFSCIDRKPDQRVQILDFTISKATKIWGYFYSLVEFSYHWEDFAGKM